jgi:hypothetical protein
VDRVKRSKERMKKDRAGPQGTPDCSRTFLDYIVNKTSKTHLEMNQSSEVMVHISLDVLLPVIDYPVPSPKGFRVHTSRH